MQSAVEKIRLMFNYREAPKEEQVFIDHISNKNSSIGKRQALRLHQVLNAYPNPDYQAQS